MLDLINLNKLERVLKSQCLTLLCVSLAFVVIALGAYTRLKDAGLGCPDWPGCYGQWIVRSGMIEDSNFYQSTTEKAWIEMIHRYCAGLLGLGILGLAISTFSYRQRGLSFYWPPLALLLLVIVQALLGMWTVTLRLYPVVVMLHLMGGFLTISGLWFWYWRLNQEKDPKQPACTRVNRLWVGLAIIALLIQCLLGGWTSANYAALVCLDFPFCQGFQNPPLIWFEAFHWLAAGHPGSPGSPLSFEARATVHMVHRVWGMITFFCFLLASWKLWRNGFSRTALLFGIALLFLQIGLGIFNIVAFLPLPSALMHNLIAVLLLLTWIRFWLRLAHP